MLTRTAKISFILAMLLFLSSTAFGSAYILRDIKHADERDTAKLIFFAEGEEAAAMATEEDVSSWLSENSRLFGLAQDLSSLKLLKIRQSLLGRHYHFQQYINGIPVQYAEIIVSVSDDGNIFRVFNNTYPKKKAVAGPESIISSEAALDRAWAGLRVHGKLLSIPKAELLYLPFNNDFRLAYRTEVEVTAPSGSWQQIIDAVTGEVLDVKNLLIDGPAEKGGVNFDTYKDELTSRTEAESALLDLLSKNKAVGQRLMVQNTRDGSALVFDPDPRTTLMDDTLQDTDADTAFDPAYQLRTLSDITEENGTYKLEGLYAVITDFEAPDTPPSTTTDGSWTAKRGDNAFNDAMAYFHIDQNQRYLQSLGFTGGTGIQEGSIEIDTDGQDGLDISGYYVGSNRLTFGHGCVDGTEDSDIILHEYGHAIENSIISTLWQGDWGGIGEGFGDYWAGSYRYTTPNAPDFFPARHAGWNSHNDCKLGGRFMDKLDARYDPTEGYSAHEIIDGSFQADELWSTPLFQSLLQLMEMGRPREEMDRIIVESHFGLGSGITMREMANVTIATAAALYPGGPHAQVYFDWFTHHNIIQPSLTAGDVIVADPGDNGTADPGEAVLLLIPLTNTITEGVTGITAALSSTTAEVNVIVSDAAYPDIGAGGTANNIIPFSVYIPASHPCGERVDLNLEVNYTDDAPRRRNILLSFGTGAPVVFSQSITHSPPLEIEDGVFAYTAISVIDISGTNAFVTENFNLDVDITHECRNHMYVKLVAPDDSYTFLHLSNNNPHDCPLDLKGNFPADLTPYYAFEDRFLGIPLDGRWTLKAMDLYTNLTGRINGWTINDVTGVACEEPLTQEQAEKAILKNCFIATAAYGSYLNKNVMVLKDFRDNYLLTNHLGRIFVDFYYKNSPPVADYISRHDTLRVAARLALTPVVYTVKYPGASLSLLCLSLLGLLFITARRKK